MVQGKSLAYMPLMKKKVQSGSDIQEQEKWSVNGQKALLKSPPKYK